MSINPITVTRLPTFVLVGHSNADGWGQSDQLLAQHTDLLPRNGATIGTDTANCYWKNIYVASSPQPYPGASHTPTIASVGDVSWLELTIANVKTNGDTHPHAHPHNYPNNRGSCYPRYMYNAWKPTGFDGFHYDYGTPSKTNGTLIGVEIPFAVYWRNFWASQVGMVKMAFSSTLMLPVETGTDPVPWLDPDLTPPYSNTPASAQTAGLAVPSSIDTTLGAFNAWWTPGTQWDWSPSTGRIYQLWYDKMVGAAAALPAGSKLDVRCLLVWFGDNDSLFRSRKTLEASWKLACEQMKTKMRQACADNDWTTLPAEQIPVVWVEVHAGYAGPALAEGLDPVAFCNGVLADLATDDPYMRVVPNSDWAMLSDEPEEPPLGMGTGGTHYSHNGYVVAAKDLFTAWDDIRIQSFDAIPAKDRVTLEAVMDEVRMRYDRGRTQSDLRDDVLISFINKSIRHIVNQVGDNCWWLNRRTDMVLTFGSDGVASLPEHVARALRIEDPDDPREKVSFDQIGFGDGGRVQIVLTDEWRGTIGTETYRVHHIGWPLDVTKAEQLLPIPRQIMEWVVVETCKRMPSGSTDIAKYSLLMGEANEIATRCMRTVGAQQRASRDTIHSARPWVQLRY